jgi:hypothetical protein
VNNSDLVRYAGKDLVIDTNILLLLLVGRIDPRRIANLRCTKQFAIEDYESLESFAARFGQLVTTPQVLTEVSNWLGTSFERRSWAQAYQSLREIIAVSVEIFEPAKHLAENDYFSRLGITDVSRLSIADGALFLTDDFALASVLEHLGRPVINFNHLRTFED